MKHTPTVCIIDSDKERCLRQEKALDKAIANTNIHASGISNYGACYLARTGYTGEFPAIEVDGVVFIPKHQGVELEYDSLCDFLNMLIRKGIVSKKTA